MINKTLAHYSVIEKLGAGGMGEVYRAEDAKLGRQVAIKVLPSTFSDDKERMARFEREARTLAALNHPNIASIYGLDESEGIWIGNFFFRLAGNGRRHAHRRPLSPQGEPNPARAGVKKLVF